MTVINKGWKFDWRHYSIDIFFHHGRKQWSLEVYNNKLDWLEIPLSTDADPELFFDTFEEAVEHLRVIGYHNVSRFLLGDDDERTLPHSI